MATFETWSSWVSSRDGDHYTMPPPNSYANFVFRGARSPSVSGGMTPGNQMEGGNLKLSIALGQKPTIIQKGPFYLMKQEAIPSSDVTGATNLMASKGLEHSYIKLTSKLFFQLLRNSQQLSY